MSRCDICGNHYERAFSMDTMGGSRPWEMAAGRAT